MTLDELQSVMDDVSDRIASVYRKVGRLEPRLGGDGRACIQIMDELVDIMQTLEVASERKERVN